MKTLDLFDFSLSSFSFEKNLNEDNIYLICRGTRNKQNLIAEKFNISNKEITHVGLGIFENNKLNIFNISIDKKINNSSLIIEPYKDFINLPDIFNLEIWAINENKDSIKILKTILNSYKEKNIGFDYKFNLSDNENLYCSEFVAKILNELNTFHYSFFRKETNRILMSITKNDVFEYFPVDFFLQNPKITLVYKENFNLQ